MYGMVNHLVENNTQQDKTAASSSIYFVQDNLSKFSFNTGTPVCLFLVFMPDHFYNPHLEELEGGNRLDGGHLSRPIIVIDVHLSESHARRLLDQFRQKGADPSARRAPLGREVHHAFLSDNPPAGPN